MDIVVIANLSTLCNIWVSLTLIKLFIKILNFFHNCVNSLRNPSHHLSNIHKIMLPFIECSPNIVFWVYLQFACSVVMNTSKQKTHHYIYYCCILKLVLLFLPLGFYEINFFLCTMQVNKQSFLAQYNSLVICSNNISSHKALMQLQFQQILKKCNFIEIYFLWV